MCPPLTQAVVLPLERRKLCPPTRSSNSTMSMPLTIASEASGHWKDSLSHISDSGDSITHTSLTASSIARTHIWYQSLDLHFGTLIADQPAAGLSPCYDDSLRSFTGSSFFDSSFQPGSLFANFTPEPLPQSSSRDLNCEWTTKSETSSFFMSSPRSITRERGYICPLNNVIYSSARAEGMPLNLSLISSSEPVCSRDQLFYSTGSTNKISSSPLPVVRTTIEQQKRRRAVAACTFCRSRKLRCDGNATCLQCERRQLTCTFSKSKSTDQSRRADKGSDEIASQLSQQTNYRPSGNLEE